MHQKVSTSFVQVGWSDRSMAKATNDQKENLTCYVKANNGYAGRAQIHQSSVQ